MSLDRLGGPRGTPARPSSAIAAAATVLVAFSTARGLVRGFVAMSDDAMIAMRAGDVLTEHHPLVGMASSGGTADYAFNHAGPMLFDVLALPVRLLGDGVGVAVTSAAINVAAIWGAVLTARRVGGETVATILAAGLCVLSWSMGSELLYSVWNPNVAVMSFVWFVVASWGVACGRWNMLPPALVLGSWCAQSQLGYPLSVLAVLVLAGAAALRWPCEDVDRRTRRRAIGIGAGVLALTWAQPLWEQFTSDGDGNMTRIVNSGREAQDTVGARFAARILADVVLPTSWGQPHFERAWWRDGSLPNVLVAALVLAGVSALSAVAVRVAARRGSPHGRLVLVAGAALVGGFCTLARVPAQFGIVLPSYYVRWLVPSLMLLAVGIVTTVGRSLVERRWRDDAASRRRGAIAAALVVSVVFLALTVPTRGLATRRAYQDAVGALRTEVLDRASSLPDGLPVRMRFDTSAWFLPYPYVVSAALDERDVDVVVDTPFMIRQYGAERAAGSEPTGDVIIQVGADVPAPPDGSIELVSLDESPDGPVLVYVVPPAGR